MRAAPALLAAALLAGCLHAAAPPASSAPPAATPDPAFAYEARGCDGYLLALLVEPARTDPFLPPGFHLRDPADFFRELRTGTGQALVVMAALLCAGGSLRNGTIPAFQEAFAGIFVLPPTVAGERPPAAFDFYETDHLAPPGPLRDALASWEWPALAANLTAQPLALQGTPQEFTLRADGPPRLFTFAGATPAPRDYGISVVRFWRDTPGGVARIDHTLPLQFGFGPGTCNLGAALRVAALAGPGACSAAVVAARQSFPFPATAVLEAGRHAQ
jgi:hypothetical protein